MPYVERQERFEYQLTDKGLDLYPIILAMVQWADKWMDMCLGKPIEFTHKTCGHKFNSKVVCSECNEHIDVKEVKVAAGPGYFAFMQQKQNSA